MNQPLSAIIGCGDVGWRIAQGLVSSGVLTETLFPVVRSQESKVKLQEQFMNVSMMDFDQANIILDQADTFFTEAISNLYYLVPPQKEGQVDRRSEVFIHALKKHSVPLERIVLISTTGVYGDCDGEKVTEQTPLNPTTPRSQRRADMEKQWQVFASESGVTISTLRVPGIYSNSRLPRARLQSQAPIVDPDECGYTNRIHADDLAMICQLVMDQQKKSDIYNATDGSPGKMSQYFLDVAEFLGLPKPSVMSFSEAEKHVTTDMMSYLRESRKISNKKLLETFNLSLRYKDYREGIRF